MSKISDSPYREEYERLRSEGTSYRELSRIAEERFSESISHQSFKNWFDRKKEGLERGENITKEVLDTLDSKLETLNNLLKKEDSDPKTVATLIEKSETLLNRKLDLQRKYNEQKEDSPEKLREVLREQLEIGLIPKKGALKLLKALEADIYDYSEDKLKRSMTRIDEKFPPDEEYQKVFQQLDRKEDY